MQTYVIRIGIASESDGFYCQLPQQCRLGDAMHVSMTRPSEERIMGNVKSAASIKRVCSTTAGKSEDCRDRTKTARQVFLRIALTWDPEHEENPWST